MLFPLNWAWSQVKFPREKKPKLIHMVADVAFCYLVRERIWRVSPVRNNFRSVRESMVNLIVFNYTFQKDIHCLLSRET